jgi:hypothetical protein
MGIQMRSGTNYLCELLKLHPHCLAPGPIWEDYAIHHSDLLRDYVNSMYAHHDPRWKAKTPIMPRERLLRFFGDALSRFLKLQVTETIAAMSCAPENSPTHLHHNLLLTKTPSVKEIHNFFDLFPDAHLLIIVRDGRAVVESGARSFGWNHEVATHNWASAAKSILDCQNTCRDFDKQCLITKYEDLFLNTHSELLRILAWLGLDPEEYDFDAAGSLPVIGSSELRKHRTDKIHWDPVETSSSFDPMARFSHWKRRQHERFNWIAGPYMSKFGYCLQTSPAYRRFYSTRNVLLDLKWKLSALRLVRAIRNALLIPARKLSTLRKAALGAASRHPGRG